MRSHVGGRTRSKIQIHLIIRMPNHRALSSRKNRLIHARIIQSIRRIRRSIPVLISRKIKRQTLLNTEKEQIAAATNGRHAAVRVDVVVRSKHRAVVAPDWLGGLPPIHPRPRTHRFRPRHINDGNTTTRLNSRRPRPVRKLEKPNPLRLRHGHHIRNPKTIRIRLSILERTEDGSMFPICARVEVVVCGWCDGETCGTGGFEPETADLVGGRTRDCVPEGVEEGAAYLALPAAVPDVVGVVAGYVAEELRGGGC